MKRKIIIEMNDEFIDIVTGEHETNEGFIDTVNYLGLKNYIETRIEGITVTKITCEKEI